METDLKSKKPKEEDTLEKFAQVLLLIAQGMKQKEMKNPKNKEK